VTSPQDRDSGAIALTRRLVLLLDGTWNEDAAFDQDTNVVRLRDVLAQSIADRFNTRVSIDEVNQRDNAQLELGARLYEDIEYFFFYERGVGTGPGLDRLLGGALGWGLGRNVRRAYKFLCRHYHPGSEIFVFGFSRGAYTARSLIGYLGSAGLLQAEHCSLENECQAWSYYRTAPSDRLPGVRKHLEKFTHSVGELRIACLGVFDTVGALGVPTTSFRRFNREQYEFHDVELSPIVKLNLHALAIDEHRRQFEASVWRESRFRVSNSVTEQVWFPGVHADVGGGYLSSRERDRSAVRGLDDISLDWMIKRVRAHYPDFPLLEFGFAKIRGSIPFGLHHESYTWKYRASKSGIRAIGNRATPVATGEVVVSHDRGATVVGESIHISALERLGRPAPFAQIDRQPIYLPRNLIQLLPELHERYCVPQKLAFGPDAVSVTAWGGEPVQLNRAADGLGQGSFVDQVAETIVRACARLEELEIDVLSPSWDARSLIGLSRN
jgi:hypothetical protein